MEDKEHIIHVLEQAIEALKQNDAVSLKDLSNQTIHCASCVQDSGSIAIAVLNYALSKIVERKQNNLIKNWGGFVQQFCGHYKAAAEALSSDREQEYQANILKARTSLESISNIRPYIQDVLRNASINKASRLYEHGISLGQTADLLGLTQWELSEYAGQRVVTTPEMSKNINAKKRIQMALEFFG